MFYCEQKDFLNLLLYLNTYEIIYYVLIYFIT